MSTTFQAPIDCHPPNVAPRESSPDACLPSTCRLEPSSSSKHEFKASTPTALLAYTRFIFESLRILFLSSLSGSPSKAPSGRENETRTHVNPLDSLLMYDCLHIFISTYVRAPLTGTPHPTRHRYSITVSPPCRASLPAAFPHHHQDRRALSSVSLIWSIIKH